MKRESIESMELFNLGYAYGNGEKVFSGFNFIFKEGEVLYIQGKKGAGKNTLVKLLLGLLTPNEGEYRINGTVVNEFSYAEFDAYRLNMGYSFDVGGLINNQGLYENLRFVLDYHDYLKSEERYDYIVKLMERFEFEKQKHLRPALVSSTVRKVASVLRAFILRPEMVLLDNPTQGMNVEHVPVLVELIKEHQRIHSLKHVIISSDDNTLISQLDGRTVSVTPTGFV